MMNVSVNQKNYERISKNKNKNKNNKLMNKLDEKVQHSINKKRGQGRQLIDNH